MPSFASGLFFNLWIGTSMPSVLLDGVGPRQYPPWPLHREIQRVKQLAHMPRMVGDTELLLDHPGDHRRVDLAGDRLGDRGGVWCLLPSGACAQAASRAGFLGAAATAGTGAGQPRRAGPMASTYRSEERRGRKEG